MFGSKMRSILMVAAVALCAPLAVGCYAEAEYGYAADPDAMYGDYAPPVYRGNVVYYDNYGEPYYYYGGRTVYVPRNYAYYGRYRSYYSTNRDRYHRWYSNRGQRYRGTPYRGRYRR